MTEDQEKKCHPIIHSHAVAAAAGNAIPVPGLGIAADMVTMTSMTMSLCAVFGGSLTEEAAKAQAVTAISSQGSRSAASILGDLGAMKLRSCLTLFHAAEPGETLFSAALQQFFAGQPDSRTLQLIAAQGGA